MCLIAFALHADPVCPLLIAANRDEFLDRPTEGLHRWALADGTHIVAGRDLRDGGTWLGLSPNGRVAMLTNVRQQQAGPGSRSRGELVTRWLQGHADDEQLAAAIDPAAYGGFNLVVGDFHRQRWSWLSNFARRPFKVRVLTSKAPLPNCMSWTKTCAWAPPRVPLSMRPWSGASRSDA